MNRNDGGGFNFDNQQNDYNSCDNQFNTYGLSASFLDSLGIQGPLHTKVFVANVSIFSLKKKKDLIFFLF